MPPGAGPTSLSARNPGITTMLPVEHPVPATSLWAANRGMPIPPVEITPTSAPLQEQTMQTATIMLSSAPWQVPRVQPEATMSIWATAPAIQMRGTITWYWGTMPDLPNPITTLTANTTTMYSWGHVRVIQ